ncbi:MAG: hypothetical protein OXB88_07675 [Bacteriovoracales bacterium]|nr:hypothetical protein [Bacteriovoracales bacterium]
MKKSYQQTKDKLKGLPFGSVREMNVAEKQIALENWKRLTRYRDFNSQIKKEEFQDVYSEFTTGFLCGHGDENSSAELEGDASLLRVFKAEKGIQIKVNHKASNDPKLISGLASDLALAFGKLFYQIGGLNLSESDIPEELAAKFK